MCRAASLAASAHSPVLGLSGDPAARSLGLAPGQGAGRGGRPALPGCPKAQHLDPQGYWGPWKGDMWESQ